MSKEYITKDYTGKNGGGVTELINDLVDGKVDNNNLDIDGFSGLSLDGFARRISEMWQWLLQHMHNTHTISSENGRYGIREEDFPDDILSDDTKLTSVAEFINENSDLSDQLLTKYIKEVIMNDEATINDKYWNESVAQLIDYFYHQFQKDNEKIDSSNISIGDVKDADAGNNFTDKRETLFDVNEWVIPWQNICNENYGDVRGNDKIIRVIKDSAKLQFTKKKKQTLHEVSVTDNNDEVVGSYYSIGHETDENGTIRLYDYLRLLMPEYPRIVEIEDLDRNFWVIGQVLTALCAFLFDDDGPLKNMFDGILDEICQLWENVFYLWLSAIAETKENYTTIQGVFLPVTPYENYPYLKYDNFYRTDLSVGGIKEDYSTEDSKKILESYYKQYLSYFKDLYKGTAICVVPEIRQINYAENYYAKATYLGFIVYDESVEGESKVQYNVFSYPIIIDLTYKDLGGYSTAEGMVEIQDVGYYSLRETETQYTIARRITDQISDGATPYIKLVQPQFNITLNKQNNGFWTGGKNEEIFHFYDKVSNIYETFAGVKKERNLSYKVSEIKQQDTYYIYTLTPDNTFGSEESRIAAPGNGAQTIDKKNGFYRGELISWYNIKYLGLDELSLSLMPTNIYEFVNAIDDLKLLDPDISNIDFDKDNHQLTEDAKIRQDNAVIDIIKSRWKDMGLSSTDFTLITLHRNNLIINNKTIGQGTTDFTTSEYFKLLDEDKKTTKDGKRKLLGHQKVKYKSVGGSASTGTRRAIIFNPSLNILIEYPDFPYVGIYGPTLRDPQGHNIQRSWYQVEAEADRYAIPSDKEVEFYIKATDKGVKKENWCIRYTQFFGLGICDWDEKDQTGNKNYRDYYNENPSVTQNTIDKINEDYTASDGMWWNNNKKTADVPTSVVSTLFYWDGKIYQFAVKRLGDNDNGAYLVGNGKTKKECFIEDTTIVSNSGGTISVYKAHEPDPNLNDKSIYKSIEDYSVSSEDPKKTRLFLYPRIGRPYDTDNNFIRDEYTIY